MRLESRRHMYIEGPSEDDYLLNFDWESIEDAKRCILWNGEWGSDTRSTVDLLDRLGVLPLEGPMCDFGVGVGRITAEILRRRENIFIVGVDRSLSMLSHAEHYISEELAHRYHGIDLLSFVKSRQNYAQTFSCILMIEVLQHIPEVEIDQLLPIIMKTLLPNGILFVLGNEILDAPSHRFGNVGKRSIAEVLPRYSRVNRAGISKDFATPRFWFECHTSLID
jgi:2-polyprenyl-3-methyl-5-hydroxy-6-metoxy-1,4-benzoquinol methylase